MGIQLGVELAHGTNLCRYTFRGTRFPLLARCRKFSYAFASSNPRTESDKLEINQESTGKAIMSLRCRNLTSCSTVLSFVSSPSSPKMTYLLRSSESLSLKLFPPNRHQFCFLMGSPRQRLITSPTKGILR